MRVHIILVTLLPLVYSHFVFVRIALNGVWQEPTRYIRNRTEGPYDEPDTPDANFDYRYYQWPTYPSTDYPESIRCGRDTMIHAYNTETLTVKAGDTIEFAHVRNSPQEWLLGQWTCPEHLGTCGPDFPDYPYMDINHFGPFTAHISKVPDGMDITEYDGSGQWVKIWTLGLKWEEHGNGDQHILWLPCNSIDGSYTRPSPFRFNIPKQTPAGQYLLRPDLVLPGMKPYLPSGAQLYPACAQINVENDDETATDLPEGIKIPGDFGKGEIPGFYTSWEMANGYSIDPDYVYPGGPLWDGITYTQDRPEYRKHA